MRYAFAINFYEPANMYELPFPVATRDIDENSQLTCGPHIIEMPEMTEDQMEAMLEKLNTMGCTLKVIGVHELTPQP